MKRLAAILLLSVHLFYLGGYTLVFQYFINRADSQMDKQVYGSKIENANLILLKVPVNMPTVTDWTDYETVAGQIQVKDAYYNYVRLKMTHDTMYFVCLANKAKTNLVKANKITANQIADVPVSKKSADPLFKKITVLSEYNLQSFEYNHSIFGAALTNSHRAVSACVSNPYIESPGKPPNLIA